MEIEDKLAETRESSAQPAGMTDGWVMVPREPTIDMAAAICLCMRRHYPNNLYGLAVAQEAMKDAFAVAPSIDGLSKGDLIRRTGDVDQGVSVLASGAQEEAPVTVDAGLDSAEHDLKPTILAGPHKSEPTTFDEWKRTKPSSFWCSPSPWYVAQKAWEAGQAAIAQTVGGTKLQLTQSERQALNYLGSALKHKPHAEAVDRALVICDHYARRAQLTICHKKLHERMLACTPHSPSQAQSRYHAYEPNKEYPWFCGKCGYAEHESWHQPASQPPATGC